MPRTVATFRSGVAGRAVGVLLLTVAIGLCVAVPIVAVEAFRSDPEAVGGALTLVGFLLALPGAVAAAVWALHTDGRALLPRHGRIEIDGDALVIHDRWLLRFPLRLERADIACVRPSKRAPFTFSMTPSMTPQLGTAVVDWSLAVNVRIELTRFRSFPEALRTPLPKSGRAQISRGRASEALLVRVARPDAFVADVSSWLAESRRSARRAATVPVGCLAAMLWGTWTVATCVGCALCVIGLEMTH